MESWIEDKGKTLEPDNSGLLVFLGLFPDGLERVRLGCGGVYGALCNVCTVRLGIRGEVGLKIGERRWMDYGLKR